MPSALRPAGWMPGGSTGSGACCTTLRPCELDWCGPLSHRPRSSALTPYTSFFSLCPLRSPVGSCSHPGSKAPGQASKTGHCPLLTLHPEKEPPYPPMVLPLCLTNLILLLCEQIGSRGGEQVLLVGWAIETAQNEGNLT